ncbi:hypothetical protein GDO81_020149 [Engystomops pustulosus]|uniref:Taste receptor type 2 n=1 Tax=Engystomops pustulosus TaxID=76066 RepID=A0AAV6Z1Q4_ENGPU|nr:hypothetical protein GDO81_020149 [Engystomops pustulosus]
MLVTFLLSKQEILNVYVVNLVRKPLDLSVTVAILDVIYNFFSYANIWLTSLLFIVFYLKISNLHTRLFLYLRRMTSHRTGRLIAASILLSAINCVIAQCMRLSKVTKGGTYNVTKINLFKTGSFLLNFIIGTFLPLFFYCISSVLLFISLYHHTTRMKMSSNLSINLETYYSAMKLVSFTFIYNTMYFFGHFIILLCYQIYYVMIIWPFLILDFLPILHSSYLIYTTAKLRNPISQVLHNIMDFFFQRKNTEARETIQVAAQ